jgi:acid phosphatase type 7
MNKIESSLARQRFSGLVVLVISAALAACAESTESEGVEVRGVATSEAQPLSAPVTVNFQDGVSGYTGTRDAKIAQNAATTNYGTVTPLVVDGDEPAGSGNDVASLLKWDISSIPSNATVLSASISFNVSNPSSGSYPIFALKRSWTEGSVSWQNASSGVPWQTSGARGTSDRETTSLGGVSAPGTGAVTVSLNAAGVAKIQEWIASSAANFGVVLADSAISDGLAMAARENATATSRPKLSVTYGVPDSGGSVLLAAGDVGNCNSTGDTSTGNLLDTLAGPILALGDLAYDNGTAAEFANCFDPPWGRHKSRIAPSPGNHEYNTTGAAPYYSYFGAAAGDPSKGYYSYDYAGWHVVSLNSNCSNVSCSAGGAQEQWLRQDLAAHPASCTLAFMHHPRYNSGPHGNSTSVTPLWQALMDFNADVVLAGHEHSYERWVPMDANGNTNANGIREFVVGTGGTGLTGYTGTKPANSVVRSGASFGVLQMTLNPASYSWQFVAATGAFTDQGSGTCH